MRKKTCFTVTTRPSFTLICNIPLTPTAILNHIPLPLLEPTKIKIHKQKTAYRMALCWKHPDPTTATSEVGAALGTRSGSVGGSAKHRSRRTAVSKKTWKLPRVKETDWRRVWYHTHTTRGESRDWNTKHKKHARGGVGTVNQIRGSNFRKTPGPSRECGVGPGTNFGRGKSLF